MDALAREVAARFQAASQKCRSHANRIVAIIKAFLIVVDEIPAIPALMFADPRQNGRRREIPAPIEHGALRLVSRRATRADRCTYENTRISA
jgi:hypothetical protein